MVRNSCRTPWQNRLDLRMAQALRIGGTEVRLEADLVNLLNLVDGSSGRIETSPAVVPLYESGTPEFIRWSGGVARSDESGRAIPTPAWNPLSPDSQWQVQLGLRVTFDQGRR